MSEASYDRELSERNELIVNILINQIVKNLINIGANSLEIANKVIKANPEIIQEDERKTSAKEAEERRRYVEKNAGDVSDSYRREIEKEAARRIVRRRIANTLPEAESYLRLAHNLFVRFNPEIPDGYSWSRFYTKEEEEPEKEKIIRESLDDCIRKTFRHDTVCNIVKYSYKYWDIIKNKDIDFLANHFSSLFPGSDFSDKLEIIYGRNDNKRNYVSPEDLDIIWTFIHGTIKLCIKYMYYTGRRYFKIKTKNADGESVVSEIVRVNVPEDISKWQVKTDVRTDNLEMWYSA